MKKIVLLLVLCTTTILFAQEKVKGNREPSTVITDVDPFNIIDISGDYEVAIVESVAPQVEITTDSNLHEYLDITIIEGRLSISSSVKIRSKKEMTIRIMYPVGLEKIIASEKAEISSITALKFEQIELEAQDDAKLFITADIENLKLTLKGNSKSELNLTGNNAEVIIADKANMKALVKYTDITVRMEGRTNAKIEGDINTGFLILENRSDFTGDNLVFNNLNLEVSQNATATVNVKDALKLSAEDETKVEVFNSPQITLEKFTGKTQLIKK